MCARALLYFMRCCLHAESEWQMQPRLGANDRPLSNPGERLQLALEAAERPAAAGLLMLARSALGACYTSTSTTYGSRFARARSGS